MTANAPPLRPAQGIAVAPVAIVLGSPQTIPFPTDPSGGPVPWRTPWLVVLNSSPFTLLVATGATTTQIAAFTSDKVYVYATGTGGPPVTVAAQGGSGTPGPGSDSTVYATWYADEPPGTYPAALGSGAVADIFDSGIITATTLALPTGGPGFAAGPFKTTGFGGVIVFVQELSGLGPLTVTLTWETTPPTLTITQRTVIVPASGVANFSLPNFGPLFTFSITNGTAANLSTTANVNFMPTAVTSWDVEGTPSILIPATVVVIPNTSVATLNAASVWTYAGPATWWTFWNNMTTGFAILEYQTTTGTWLALAEVDIGTTAISNQLVRPPVTNLEIPPNPLRIRVSSSSGGSPFFTVAADDWRHAA